MKRFTAFFLAAVLAATCLAFTGCSSEEDAGDSGQSQTEGNLTGTGDDVENSGGTGNQDGNVGGNAAGANGEDLETDLKNGASDLAGEIKDGADELMNDVEKGANDVKNGVEGNDLQGGNEDNGANR